MLEQWRRHKRDDLFITHDVEEAVFLSSSVLVVEKTPIQESAGDSGAYGKDPYPTGSGQSGDRSLREGLVDMLRKQVGG